MDADFGDSHIHTSAKEVAISVSVIVILDVTVFKVTDKWTGFWSSGQKVVQEPECYVQDSQR